MADYDAVIVGSGINSLVARALLQQPLPQRVLQLLPLKRACSENDELDGRPYDHHDPLPKMLKANAIICPG